MEEIILVIIQFLFELFLNSLFWLPFEFMKGRIWIFGLGGILGGAVSVFLRPHHIIGIQWIRTMNLVLTPVLLAYFIQWAERKIIHKNDEEAQHTFFEIFTFAFILTLFRYLFAK